VSNSSRSSQCQPCPRGRFARAGQTSCMHYHLFDSYSIVACGADQAPIARLARSRTRRRTANVLPAPLVAIPLPREARAVRTVHLARCSPALASASALSASLPVLRLAKPPNAASAVSFDLPCLRCVAHLLSFCPGPGRFADQPGSAACQPCPVNTEDDGGSACRPCKGSTFALNPGSPKCTP
jgi:hypothetical protein